MPAPSWLPKGILTSSLITFVEIIGAMPYKDAEVSIFTEKSFEQCTVWYIAHWVANVPLGTGPYIWLHTVMSLAALLRNDDDTTLINGIHQIGHHSCDCRYSVILTAFNEFEGSIFWKHNSPDLFFGLDCSFCLEHCSCTSIQSFHRFTKSRPRPMVQKIS